MENSILEKEDKYIKDGYKQVYPNNKDIKVLYLAEDSYVDTMVTAAILLKHKKLEKLGGINNGKEDK